MAGTPASVKPGHEAQCDDVPEVVGERRDSGDNTAQQQ